MLAFTVISEDEPWGTVIVRDETWSLAVPRTRRWGGNTTTHLRLNFYECLRKPLRCAWRGCGDELSLNIRLAAAGLRLLEFSEPIAERVDIGRRPPSWSSNAPSRAVKQLQGSVLRRSILM